MYKVLGSLCLALLLATQVFASSKREEEKRLSNAATVLKEVLNTPENIPRDTLNKAECVIVIPSVMKAAFGVGGSYGRGAMVCRTGKDFNGPWGAPAMYALEGGSFGFQMGAQATDFVLLVMNPRGVNSILDSKVKLGGDVSASAGPKGRTVEADTDAHLRAEILTYSRSRGLFAGASLEGSTLRPDNEANKDIYGREATARNIVREKAAEAPLEGQQIARILNQASPRNGSS
jgi:SH3 domain-containing YSC84-like protein 1